MAARRGSARRLEFGDMVLVDKRRVGIIVHEMHDYAREATPCREWKIFSTSGEKLYWIREDSIERLGRKADADDLRRLFSMAELEVKVAFLNQLADSWR